MCVNIYFIYQKQDLESRKHLPDLSWLSLHDFRFRGFLGCIQEFFPAWKLPNNVPPRPALFLRCDGKNGQIKVSKISGEHCFECSLHVQIISKSTENCPVSVNLTLVLGETASIPSSVKRGRLYYCTGSLNHTISVVQTEALCITFYKLTEPLRALIVAL